MTIYGQKIVYGVHLTRKQLYHFFEDQKKKDEDQKKKDEDQKKKDTEDVVCAWFEKNQSKLENKYNIVIWEIPHDQCKREEIDRKSFAIGIDVAQIEFSNVIHIDGPLLIDLNYQSQYDNFLQKLRQLQQQRALQKLQQQLTKDNKDEDNKDEDNKDEDNKDEDNKDEDNKDEDNKDEDEKESDEDGDDNEHEDILEIFSDPSLMMIADDCSCCS